MKDSSSFVFLTLFGLIIFTSCENRCCDLLIKSIRQQCENKFEKCSVSFSSAFDLKWDTLYIFDSMLYPEEVSKTLGLKYNGDIVPEGESLFIFVYKGNIVKEQKSQCSDIIFVKMKEDGVVKISSQGIYIVKQKMLNDKIYYLLFPS